MKNLGILSNKPLQNLLAIVIENSEIMVYCLYLVFNFDTSTMQKYTLKYQVYTYNCLPIYSVCIDHWANVMGKTF